MADFKIKSAAGTGNKTLIQGQDQSGSNYAIQIGDAGASTLHNATLTNATITAWTPPAGTILQVQGDSYYNEGAAVAVTDTSGVLVTQVDVAFTAIKGTNSKMMANWWLTGQYTTTTNSGLSLGLRYSTNDWVANSNLHKEWISMFMGYGEHNRKEHTSGNTGLFTVPTASAMRIRFMVKVNSGSHNMCQDVGDSMGLTVYEIAQ